MKKFFAILMASLLLVSAFALVASADTVTPNAPIKVAINGTEGAPDYPSAEGGASAVYVYTNTDKAEDGKTAVEKVWTIEDNTLRYMFFFITNSSNNIVGIGNNIVGTGENKPQFNSTVTIPAGGRVVAFYWNADKNTANQALKDVYDALAATLEAAPGNGWASVTTNASAVVSGTDILVFKPVASGVDYTGTVTGTEGVADYNLAAVPGTSTIYVYAGEATEKVWTLDNNALRYNWFFIVDGNNKIVGIGNNVLGTHEGKPQFNSDVTIPANGKVVTFYYNAGNPTDLALMNLYNEIKTANEVNPGNAWAAVETTATLTVDGTTVTATWPTTAPEVAPGDASNVIVFAILAIVAIAGSAVVVKTRR